MMQFGNLFIFCNLAIYLYFIGGIVLGWIFRKWDVGVWTRLSWLRIETWAGNCECCNEPSGSVKCGEFLD
jgi:hypothetical protein